MYPDGATYSGNFLNNLKDGNGEFTFKDGSYYVGSWKDDLKDGKGVFKWADEHKFNGSWDKGEPKEGNLTMPDGQIRTVKP